MKSLQDKHPPLESGPKLLHHKSLQSEYAQANFEAEVRRAVEECSAFFAEGRSYGSALDTQKALQDLGFVVVYSDGGGFAFSSTIQLCRPTLYGEDDGGLYVEQDNSSTLVAEDSDAVYQLLLRSAAD